MVNEALPFLVVGALIAGTVASYRLHASAQPLRLELAAKGEAFLANEDAPVELRRQVAHLLDSAFGQRVVLTLAIFLLPAVAVMVLFRRDFVMRMLKEQSAPNRELQADYDEIVRLHDRITLANHPILLPVLELMVLLIFPPIVVITGVLRGRLPTTLRRETVMTYVETREPVLLHRKLAA